MGLGMLLFLGLPLVLLLGGGVFAAQKLMEKGSRQPSSPGDLRRILDARLASGEIDREEYDTLRARLEA